MIKKRYNSNSKCLKLCAIFLFPFALFGGIALTTNNQTIASSESYVRYYNEKVNLTNSNFEQGATPFAKGDSLAGWNAIEKDSHATGMLIDVGRGTNSDDSSETTTFSNNKDDYMLSANPGAHGKDSRILMINSKEKLAQKNIEAFLGYRSSSITLEANSNYVFSVSAKAMKNGDEYVQGSIYLNGLVDKDGQTIKLGYENFSNSTWREYYFFVSTGASSQTVTLDLYLGASNGTRSEGAVFFDNVNITRYSQNQFFELSQAYGYENEDIKFIKYKNNNEISSDQEKSIFLINELQEKYYIYENFEEQIDEDSDALGQHWQIIAGGRSNANAQILDVRNTSQKDFETLTGHNYVGDDFSHNNNQALVLWTNTNNNYSSNGFIGVKSEDIKLEPHSVYKVSLKMKVSDGLKGAFTLKVNESDFIYTAYPTLLNSDSSAKNYYALQSGQTSGITSNVTNAWTNDYQTVEMFIKSHSMFTTAVNLELWLGDSSNKAEGCVAIDNIMIERASYETFSNASNQYEFKWNEANESENDSFKNSKFNKSEVETNDGKFPVKASEWTITKENDKINESGIIYLADKEAYDNLYKDKNYLWAGINPNKTNNPNNVYMMFNKENSFQSLLSSASTINANSYYKLSFDYYNQFFSNSNESKIKVEVIDENDIVLFSKDDVQSLDAWASMDIYIRTAETVAHSIQVKISLGEEDNKVGGIVYLDNFTLTSSESFSEAFANAENKSDLTNYYLKLDGSEFSGIKNSPAYTFKVDEVYDANFGTENSGNIGGIAHGKNNDFGIINENNLLVISNRVASSTTLQTNFNLSMSADSFYELSFDLATFFGEKAGTTDKDHKECKYGFKVTIDGYEAVSEIIGDGELKPYKIYYKSSSESSNPKISFTLISDCDNSLGTAIISNLNFTSSDEATYANLSSQPGFEKSIFKATVSNENTQTPDDDTDTDTDNTDTSSASSTWILIPSIIMGVALIVAIIGMIFKRIKIKKIDKIKKESYDRKISVNHDIIMAEAQKKRDFEVQNLQAAKNRLLEERQLIEQEHKDYVKEQRTATNGKISKAIETEFKKYNANVARLDEKINILNEKIENCMTADYLLSIERKLIMEEDERLTAERRERKALEKEMRKRNKSEK